MKQGNTSGSQSLKPSNGRRGLIARLAQNTAGNTLMLVGGAIFPLVGMIGAGVDISRTYLVKSRLQAACDAGVLAGRKYASNATFDAAAREKANAFFNNNFPAGAFGTTNINFTPTQNGEGEIVGTAVARVPMTVMQVFGNQRTDLSVSCDARLDIGNVDVALVLDVTGSMNDPLGGGTRISALKEAVINFYNILGPGDTEKGRIRYAIVPYSTNVNVGYSIPAQYLTGGTGSADWIYQTRVANMTKPVYTGTPGPASPLSDQTFSSGTGISAANCGLYGQNRSFSGFTGGTNPTNSGGPAPAATTSTSYSNNATAGVDWGWSGAADTSGTTRSCRRKRTATTTTYTLIGYTRTDSNPWTYRQASVDITGYAQGTPVNIFAGNSIPNTQYVPDAGQYDMRSLLDTPGSTVTGGTSVTWNGCIEEADTLDTITASTPVTSVPAGAYDLDMNLVPDSDETRWRPAWINMIYNRTTLADSNSGSKESNRGCPPQPARRLMEYASLTSPPTGFGSLSSFQTYVNSLQLTGGTMHDIGFIWGARFISGGGIFAADNPDSWYGEPVSRHIIFMTDGLMNAHNEQYVFHGWNQLDQRVAPRGTSKTSMDAIHSRRFRIMCEQAKAANMTVWMIALAEPDSAGYPDMRACASTADHFKFVESADELNDEFRRIASNIAELRLTR